MTKRLEEMQATLAVRSGVCMAFAAPLGDAGLLTVRTIVDPEEAALGCLAWRRMGEGCFASECEVVLVELRHSLRGCVGEESSKGSLGESWKHYSIMSLLALMLLT